LDLGLRHVGQCVILGPANDGRAGKPTSFRYGKGNAMIDFLKRAFSGRHRARTRPAPPDHLIYAVGDIHGCLDQLDRLLTAIRADAKGERAEIVFVGDYIDRGPDSRAVVERLINLDFPTGLKSTFLKGNHEQVLLDFLAGDEIGDQWVQFGGADTLASYGVTPPSGSATQEKWSEIRRDLQLALPESHLQFYRETQICAERGCYLFVHAGVNPDTPLTEQTERDMMWIRDPFLYDERALDRIIVHGHTPEEKPFCDNRRIGIDTGVYATGVLTAVRLQGRRVRFLTS
jgi:serine/threonine protein phosphatase 1